MVIPTSKKVTIKNGYN